MGAVAGRRSAKPMNIKNLFWYVVVGTIVFLMGVLALPVQTGSQEKKDEKITNNIIKEERGPSGEIPPLDLYLDNLEKFECPNCGPRYKRVDSNGKYSYGCLQFQSATWREMVRKHDPDSKRKDDEEIHSRIYECKYQKQIAGAMFKENPKKASFHWYTTIYKKGLGLPKI